MTADDEQGRWTIRAFDVTKEQWFDDIVKCPNIYSLGRLLNATEWVRLRAYLLRNEQGKEIVEVLQKRSENCTYSCLASRAECCVQLLRGWHEEMLEFWDSEEFVEWPDELCEPDLRFERSNAEHWLGAEKPVVALAENLDENEAHVLWLGVHVDRKLRPFLCGFPEEVAKSVASGVIENSHFSHHAGWLEDIRGRSCRIGLDCKDFCSDADRSKWNLDTLVQKVDQWVRLSLREIESATQQPKSEKGILGMWIDRENRKVWREGYDEIVDFSRCSESWQAFRFCWEAGEDGTRWEKVKDGYEGEWDARHEVRQELCEKLKPIGITVAKRKLQLIDLR